MGQILKALVENCEIGIQRDAAGWSVKAKGALALVALLIGFAIVLFAGVQLWV